jgi:formiminotetrahydrofolate cyclodeaminase
MIQVANVDGTNACDVTVDVHSAASGGGTAYSLVSTASVAADSSLVVLDKNTALYLEEDRSITATLAQRMTWKLLLATKKSHKESHRGKIYWQRPITS